MWKIKSVLIIVLSISFILPQTFLDNAFANCNYSECFESTSSCDASYQVDSIKDLSLVAGGIGVGSGFFLSYTCSNPKTYIAPAVCGTICFLTPIVISSVLAAVVASN